MHHSERVRAFAMGIAEEIELAPERRAELSRAARRGADLPLKARILATAGQTPTSSGGATSR